MMAEKSNDGTEDGSEEILSLDSTATVKAPTDPLN